ncbi:hypothetical protein ACN469_23365 [Corallococcus terminator]
MAVVVASLSLMLCAQGCTAKAQSEQEAPKAAKVPAQTATPAEVSELWNSVSGLRAEVRQLKQEVAKLRAQVNEQAQRGTGGAGTGTQAQEPNGSEADAQARGTGGPGAAGTAPRQVENAVPPAGTNVPAPTGTAVVLATFTGTVRSVAPPDIVLAQDSGEPLTLEVSPRTRVLRDGKSIGVRDLDPGDRVNAVVDMVGEHETVEISVLRKEDPNK